MVDSLTVTGLTIDDYQTRRAAAVAQLRSEISAVLDASPEQPTGQLVDILLERIQANAELLQSIHSAVDPGQATGQSLDGVSSITGSYREPATKGLVGLSLELQAATTVTAGRIVSVAGDPDNQWVLLADVTSVGAGFYPGVAEASEVGVIPAVSGTITVIVTPVGGWLSVFNPLDAVPGSAEETDVAFRLRRELEVTLGGSCSIDSIRAELVNMVGMISARVYENATWLTGIMPPHSIEAVIWDGVVPAVADADIYDLLYDQKPAGIQADGWTSIAYTDAQGNPLTIGFTRATQQIIEMEYTITTDSTYPDPGVDAVLKAALAQWDNDNIDVADDMIYSRWLALPYELVDGITDVTLFRWRIQGAGAYHQANINIGGRANATVDTGDIVVI